MVNVNHLYLYQTELSIHFKSNPPKVGQGYWNNETDTLTCEDTIVVILEDISKEIVYKICDEVIVELNQNSILIETGNIKTDFYSLTK